MQEPATDRRSTTPAHARLIAALCLLLAPTACTQPTKFTPLPKGTSSSQTSGQQSGSLSKTPPAKSNAPLASPAPATPPLPGQWQSIAASDPRAAHIPASPREFRGVWVATVDNIDWPSTKFLTSAQQQAEIARIVDTAASLNFNTIVLQVRPTATRSIRAPSSPGVSSSRGAAAARRPRPTTRLPCGSMPPTPKACSSTRGSTRSAPAIRRHSSPTPPRTSARRHPAMVKKYGDYLWLDPGEPWVHDRAISIVRDLLSRYDLDGIHIDDYFYPYPTNKTRVR